MSGMIASGFSLSKSSFSMAVCANDLAFIYLSLESCNFPKPCYLGDISNFLASNMVEVHDVWGVIFFTVSAGGFALDFIKETLYPLSTIMGILISSFAVC